MLAFVKVRVMTINGCDIIKTYGPNYPERFLVRRGKFYIGKVSDGGYSNIRSAVNFAKRQSQPQ